MEQDKVDAFKAKARAEAQGVQLGVKPKQVALKVTSTSETHEEQTVIRRAVELKVGSSYQSLSERALGNLLKLTGFSSRLFSELTEEQLQNGFNYQLARYDNLGIITVGNEIKGMFDNTRFGHTSYETLMPPAEKLAFIDGDPILEDSVAFQTIDKTIDIGGSPMLLGVHCLVSSTPNSKSRINYGLYRRICSNRCTVPFLMNQNLEAIDDTILQAVMAAFHERLNVFTDRVESFVRLTESVRLTDDDVFAEMVNQCPVPNGMREGLKACRTRPEETREVMQGAGIGGMNTLWDAFNYLLYMAGTHPKKSGRMSTARNVYKWADSVLNATQLV